MSELDYINELDEEDPPPLDGSLSVGYYLRGVINRLGEGSLRYTDYVNPESNCHIAVNAHDLEVIGSVRGYEIPQLLSPPLHETVEMLEQQVSKAMARAAMQNGYRRSSDSRYDNSTYISPADTGTIAILFPTPDIRAQIIGIRSADEETLSLQSRHIKRAGELEVLLSGLAVFLTAMETIKHHNSTK